MGVKLVYKDLALGADEDAVVTTSAKEPFSDITKLPFGVETPTIATVEPNGWGLIHDYHVRGEQPFAFWSTERSGADCVFASTPTITFTFTEQYTITGITIRFAPASMDFCRKIGISWYQGTTLKANGMYNATSPQFVINETVEAFDRIVFTFLETNLPGKRCKVEGITMGVIRTFEGDELKSVNVIHEVDLISENMPINVLDSALHSKDEIDYIFQKKQPVKAYNDDVLVGVYYIEKGQRAGRLDYTISCKDRVGLFDLVTQPGGLWLTDTPLTTILTSVFGDTSIFDIDDAYTGATLRGYIEPETTQREALQQIAFALGAVVDTSGSDKVKIFPMQVGEAIAISPKKIYTGGVVNTSDTVTEVTVTAYIFSDERPGDDDESIEYNGIKYKYYTDTKHAYNPNTVTSDPENKKKFDKHYLCNLSNAQTIANKIMAYYERRDKYVFKHVLEGQTPAGYYSAELAWESGPSGNITKMTITTTGITVSSTEMLLDE